MPNLQFISLPEEVGEFLLYIMLNREIEKDRLAHGKKPLKKKDDNQPPASGGTGNDKDSISEELPEDVKTQKCSISDPESG